MLIALIRVQHITYHCSSITKFHIRQFAIHRRSQDFVWGCTFSYQKADDLFLVVAFKERLNTPPNLTRPQKTVLKIDSCSGWGCTSCPRGCTYIFPVNYAWKKIFSTTLHRLHPPGYAYVAICCTEWSTMTNSSFIVRPLPVKLIFETSGFDHIWSRCDLSFNLLTLKSHQFKSVLNGNWVVNLLKYQHARYHIHRLTVRDHARMHTLTDSL